MNFKKLFAGIMATAVMFPALLFGLPIESVADSFILISESNFTDENFREYVKQFDTNGDNKLSEAERNAVKSINVSNENHKISWGAGAGTVVLDSDAKEIKNISGIEFFTEIESLNISCNPNLTKVNLYNNTKLKKIVAHNTGLEIFSETRLTSLTDLRIWNTNIDYLYLPNSTELKYLDISFTELIYLDITKSPLLCSLVNNTEPSTLAWNGKDYLQYSSSGITLNTNKGAIIVSEISSSPDGCSLLAKWHNLFGFDDNSLRIIDGNTVEFYEAYNVRIAISDVVIPDGKSITAVINWDGKIKNIDITKNTDYITIDRNLMDEMAPDELYHSYLIGHFDITIKTNSGSVLYDFDIEAYDRNSFGIKLADCYMDSRDYYFDTDSIKVYIPADVRDKVSSYRVFKNSWVIQYASPVISGNYDGGEYLTIKFPEDELINGNIKYNGYHTVFLFDSTGFILTKLYPFAINTAQDYFHLSDSAIDNAVIDENGVYHMNDVSSIPILNILGYDYYTLKLYRNDSLIGFLNNNEPYISDFDYGTDACKEKYDLNYAKYNDYLFPGTYRLEVWLTKFNLKLDDITFDISVSDFDSSTAEPDLEIIPEPDYPNNTTPTPTPGNTPTSTPTNAPTSSPATTPVPSGTPSTTPGTNNSGSQNGSGNSNGGNNNVSPTNTPGSSSQTPTPVIPTAAPTKAPELSIGDFVKRCYNVALGREPDDGGFNYWVNNLNNGSACGAQVGYGFIFSQEYINKNRTNEEFVTDLYNMYFGRTPDSEGFKYWVDKLNAGEDRENIFAGFANSLEFYNLCTKYGVVQGIFIVGVPNDIQGGINCFVARMYSVCLNRLPDMEGQGGWVLKLYNGEVTGTSLSYGFVFSPEFIGNNPSNGEFVAYMYRAFFGREPDQEGFNSWVDVLNNGGSYQDVFNGFTGSLEFFNLCNSYGINP